MLRRLSVALGIALLLFARSSSAQEQRPEPRGPWYGWQTAIGYVASDALLVGAIVASGSGGDPHDTVAALAVPGAAGHVLSGPIVHWSHGHVRRGFASLGLTVGSAAVTSGLFATLGYAIDSCGRSQGPLGNQACIPLWAPMAAVGLAVGTLIGNIVDLSVLSRDAPRPGGARGGVELTPILSYNRVGLGVSGRF